MEQGEIPNKVVADETDVTDTPQWEQGLNIDSMASRGKKRTVLYGWTSESGVSCWSVGIAAVYVEAGTERRSLAHWPAGYVKTD